MVIQNRRNLSLCVGVSLSSLLFDRRENYFQLFLSSFHRMFLNIDILCRKSTRLETIWFQFYTTIRTIHLQVFDIIVISVVGSRQDLHLQKISFVSIIIIKNIVLLWLLSLNITKCSEIFYQSRFIVFLSFMLDLIRNIVRRELLNVVFWILI